MGKEKTVVYAVKHKDRQIIKNSSSGGGFTALSDIFLAQGNGVASCVYNYSNDKVELRVYEDSATRNEARGSKYIQATIGNGFKDISNWLIQNPEKEIIVFGTGCQMNGLCRYLELKKLRDRATIVDLICHGATSPGLWDKYITEKKIKGKIEYLNFKDKRNGWHNPMAYAKVQGREISIKDFSDLFYGGWSIRESCYKCPYTRIDRNTDITIGDYWGIEKVNPQFADPMGVTLALVHSEKGIALFEKLRSSVDYYKSNRANCLQPRLISPAIRPEDRDSFWDDLKEKGIDYCLTKYKKNEPQNTILWKIKGKIRKIMALYK